MRPLVGGGTINDDFWEASSTFVNGRFKPITSWLSAEVHNPPALNDKKTHLEVCNAETILNTVPQDYFVTSQSNVFHCLDGELLIPILVIENDGNASGGGSIQIFYFSKTAAVLTCHSIK